MKINTNKKYRGAVSVYVANKSSVSNIAADVGNRGESCGDIGGIMYG